MMIWSDLKNKLENKLLYLYKMINNESKEFDKI